MRLSQTLQVLPNSWFLVSCETWCNAVPSVWLSTDRSYVYWPPNRANTKRCLTKGEAPGPNWSKHRIHHLNVPYGTYHFYSNNLSQTFGDIITNIFCT